MTLPPLREELALFPGPRLHDGQPSWTLQDPARNRFFRLDWVTFEVLQRWSLGTAAEVASLVSLQTPLKISADDVVAVLRFAGANQLLKWAGADVSATLVEQQRRTQPAWWLWLLHNYLFFRIPLVRPQRFLDWLHGCTGFLFSAPFWKVTLGAAIAGWILVARQWDAFVAHTGALLGLEGVVGLAVVLTLIKVLHEIGHGLAAVHFGCRVPTMGVAFLVMAPVAYTDTNDAWTLSERRPRLWIGAAGIIAELALAAWATLAWALLPDGFLRTAAFLVATTTWVKSLVINLSPIMRFDGYYLLADALDLPNLHGRAFALGRWQLREWLFGLGDAPPERFEPRLRRGLVGLAFIIWIYRLVVFLGIAVFVYHTFFKALGIVLFAVEIGWFVVTPVVSEVGHWYRQRHRVRSAPRLPWTAAALFLLAVALFIPWPRRVSAAAQVAPGHEYRVVSPDAAQLAGIDAPNGAVVEAGRTLFRLESPDLRRRVEKARVRVAGLERATVAATAEAGQRHRAQSLQAELETARAVLRDAELAETQLAPVAPFEGTFHAASPDLAPGEHLSRNELIGVLVSNRASWSIVAYVRETDALRIHVGATARLSLPGSGTAPLSARVVQVEKDTARVLSHALLSTEAGGDVATHAVGETLVPDQALYRVHLACDDTLPLRHVARGSVWITAEKESLVSRWSRRGLSLLWRELGF